MTTLGKWELDTVHNVDALELLAGLPDASVDAIITDPPYGVGKVSARRSVSERFGEINGNDHIQAEWLFDAYRVTRNCGALYMFANWQNVHEWVGAVRSAGFAVRNIVVWDKLVHGLADIETCYSPRYELIVFAAKGHHTLRGGRPADVIRHPRLAPDKLVHPYEKPVGLLERCIATSTDATAVIVDPFAGSGTTGVAAIKHGRRFIGADNGTDTRTGRYWADISNERLALPFTTPMFAEDAP